MPYPTSTSRVLLRTSRRKRMMNRRVLRWMQDAGYLAGCSLAFMQVSFLTWPQALGRHWSYQSQRAPAGTWHSDSGCRNNSPLVRANLSQVSNPPPAIHSPVGRC